MPSAPIPVLISEYSSAPSTFSRVGTVYTSDLHDPNSCRLKRKPKRQSASGQALRPQVAWSSIPRRTWSEHERLAKQLLSPLLKRIGSSNDRSPRRSPGNSWWTGCRAGRSLRAAPQLPAGTGQQHDIVHGAGVGRPGHRANAADPYTDRAASGRAHLTGWELIGAHRRRVGD